MTKKKLKREFYSQPTLKVAKELLGKYIVRKIKNKKLEGNPLKFLPLQELGLIMQVPIGARKNGAF